MNELIMELYNYAENLRNDGYFDSAMKYYKNYLSYCSLDEKGYVGLFLASIKCPNDNVVDYLINVKDIEYFKNIVALKGTEKDVIKLLDEYVNYIFLILKELDNSVEANNLFVFFDELLSFYPENADDKLINELEKIARVTLDYGFFEKSKEYYTKLLRFDNTNSIYYWNRLLASNLCSNNDQISSKSLNLEINPDYINAIEYADSKNIPVYINVKNKCRALYNQNRDEEVLKTMEQRVNEYNLMQEEKAKQEEKIIKHQEDEIVKNESQRNPINASPETINNEKKYKVIVDGKTIGEYDTFEEAHKVNLQAIKTRNTKSIGNKINDNVNGNKYHVKGKQSYFNKKDYMQVLRMIGISLCIIASLVITIICISLESSYKYSEANAFNYIMMFISTIISAVPYYFAYNNDFRRCILFFVAYPMLWITFAPWLSLVPVLIFTLGEYIIQIICTFLFYFYGDNKY